MIKMRKIAAITLALSMAALTAACGNSSGGGASTQTTAAPTKASQTESAAGSQSAAETAENDLGVWAPLPETVTITTAMSGQSTDIGFQPGEDFSHNVWFDRYQELFNVQLEIEWLVGSGSDYNTKLNMCIADNDLPDVFYVSSYATLKSLIDAGLAMDITDVLDEYASDLLKGYMNDRPDIVETASRDGRVYAIPRMSYGIISQPYPLWIRKDWREEQNLEAPKTWDETVNMLQIFYDNYGATLGADQNLSNVFKLGPIWGAYPKTWLRTDNGVEYGGVQPEMKDMLAAMSDLYTKGLLSDEFVETDSSKWQDNIAQGKYGVYAAPSYSDRFYVNVLKEKGFASNSFGEAFALPSATGEKVLYPIDFDNNGYIVINSQCEHPEAAMKVINLWPQVNFEGDEGAYGEIPEDIWAAYNRISASGITNLRVTDPNCDYNQFKDISEAIVTGDDSKLKGLGTLQKWDVIKRFLEDPESTENTDVIDRYYQVADPEVSAYAVNSKILDDGDYFNNVLFGISPDSLVETGSTLDSILVEGFTKIIIGAEPLDYFDELVETWKAAGGEQVTKDMNEMYNK